jgi:hypothetical protein
MIVGDVKMSAATVILKHVVIHSSLTVAGNVVPRENQPIGV